MAVITSAASGNALTGATWVGGIAPTTFGNSALINTGHIITNDGIWTTGDDTATAITVNGTLKASRSSSSTLTVRGDLFISTGGTLDYGTEADPIPSTVTAQILLNDSAVPGHNKWGLRTSESSNWAGFRVWGADKTGRTTMSPASNIDTVVTVADATGWQIGDFLCFGCLTSGVGTNLFRAITGISGLNITISSNLGAISPTGRSVWNVTRNVKIGGSVGNSWRSHVALRVGGSYNVTNSIEIGPCEFSLTGGTSQYYQFGGLNFSWDSATSLNGTAVKKIYRPVLHNIWSITGSTVTTVAGGGSSMMNIFGNQAANFSMTEPICAVTQYHFCQLYQGASVNFINPQVIGSYFTFTSGYSQGTVGCICTNGYFEGIQSNLLGFTGLSITFNGTVVNGVFHLFNGNYSAFGSVTYNGCTIGGTLGIYNPTDNILITNGAYGIAEFNSCIFPSSTQPSVIRGSANLDKMNPSATFMFRNKNNDPLLNEKYVYGGILFRDNSFFNRSTSSLQMGAWYSGVPTTHTSSIAVIANQTIRIKGYCQFNTTYGTATPPTLTVSGLGISPVTFTCTATANTWFPIDITVTNPQSYPGSFILTYSGQSTSNSQTANFWFDGITMSDFVSTNRHYGFLFNSQSYVTVDPVISVSTEATVGAYTGIAISGSAITLTTNHTVRELYDYCKWYCSQTTNLSVADFFTSTDGVNFTSNKNIVINGCILSGTGIITTSGTTSVSGGGTSTVTIIASNGTTGYINITGLSSHTVYLQNGSGTQLSYQSSVTGTYSFFIPAGSTGTWTYVVKKPGYTYQKGTITASTGGINTIAVNTPQKLNPDGSAMYTASTSSFCTVSFSGSTQASINISNGVVTDQQAFDTTEMALITNAGMIWLVTKGECSIFLSFGGNYLFMSTGWRLKRASAGDVNATLGAFVQSADGTAVDGVNGGVQFLTSSTTADIWNYSARTITGGGGLTTDQNDRLYGTATRGQVSFAPAITFEEKLRIFESLEELKNKSFPVVDTTPLQEEIRKTNEIIDTLAKPSDLKITVNTPKDTRIDQILTAIQEIPQPIATPPDERIQEILSAIEILNDKKLDERSIETLSEMIKNMKSDEISQVEERIKNLIDESIKKIIPTDIPIHLSMNLIDDKNKKKTLDAFILKKNDTIL